MTTAQDRLFGGYYNSAAFSGANPGGLGNGGHVQNFPSAIADIGTVAQTVGTQSAAAATAAATANDAKVAAQAAAAAAALYDPNTKANKSGDTFTGPVTFLSPNGSSLRAFGSTGANSSGLEFVGPTGSSRSYIYSDASGTVFAGGALSTFHVFGSLMISGVAPFTTANDGSGSGLDADLVRGLPSSSGAVVNTVMTRDANGDSALRRLSVAAGGGIYFSNGAVFDMVDANTLGLTKVLYLANRLSAGAGFSFSNGGVFDVSDANTLTLTKGLYLTGALSASVLTERSDRQLKTDIEELGSAGRLRPVRYRLKETGQARVGFIAQEVESVCPEAVTVGAGDFLEIAPLALIAHLAEQLNRALDRLDAAGL